MGVAAAILAAAAAGCAGSAPSENVSESQARISSALGTMLTFEFDGQVIEKHGHGHGSLQGARRPIEEQLLYTIGQLNGHGGVSSPALAEVSEITTRPLDHDATEIRYHARLPVAWPGKTDLPTSFQLVLPLRADVEGEALLRMELPAVCFDTLTETGLWYEYRPDNDGCQIPVAASRPVATVTVSDQGPSGRYPEIQKVWEDGSLDVVAVFRKDVPGSTEQGDVGRVAYVGFVSGLGALLGDGFTVTTRGGGLAPISGDPGQLAADVTIEQMYPDGRTVHVTALLEDSVTPPTDASLFAPYAVFLDRFAELVPSADVVLYNGHSGLGAEVRAFTAQMAFLPGKYQILYLDACDSFAYLGRAPWQARAAADPGDPDGTLALDVVTNANPASFAGMPAAATALLTALLPGAEPQDYASILGGFDDARLGFVQGDEDNVYAPGRFRQEAPVLSVHDRATPGAPSEYATTELPAGEYAFELHPEWSSPHPSGALALYARAGSAPGTAVEYRCEGPGADVVHRSARCAITLDSPAIVYLAVAGKGPSHFSLTGFALPRDMTRRRPPG